MEDTSQAIELYSQANNLAPTDPAILAKLGDLYDSEGDKSQAFQCHYDVSVYYSNEIHFNSELSLFSIEYRSDRMARRILYRCTIL